MTSSQRIVLNTIATYTRSVIGAGLALFSSRWVLNALGQTDFGLFSVVGSIIVFITFLNTVLSGSAARHYAYAIGQGDLEQVNRWFNAALSIHIILAFGLVFVGWIIGEYAIADILTIPPDRIASCLIVFRISLISAFASMISVPFIAMLTAKQRIAELAIWNMLNSILTFSLALYLGFFSGNKLIFYAVGMVGIICIIQIIQILWALLSFKECRVRIERFFDKTLIKEIISFAGWNLIGSFGIILRNQGSAILLNIYFGPRVNAAYGIANQVTSQADQFAAAMIGAFMPEITASEGRGDRKRMLDLAQRASKFGTILVMLFAIPLIIEMDYILKLWLKNPPEYTGILCRLMLITFLIDRLSVGSMMAVNARGKVAAYQSTLGTCLVLTLPLVWFFFKLGFNPGSVGFAFIITITAISLGRVIWNCIMFGVSFMHWVKAVFSPCLMVAAITIAATSLFYLFLPVSFMRFACILSISLFTSLVTTWLVAINKEERNFILQNAKHSFHKIRKAFDSKGSKY